VEPATEQSETSMNAKTNVKAGSTGKVKDEGDPG
jgi:hypothetical protein